MAEVIEEFSAGGRTRTGKYAWDNWFDGKIWKLTKGEDFEVPIGSFSASATGAAKSRGLKLERRIVGDSIELRASKIEG